MASQPFQRILRLMMEPSSGSGAVFWSYAHEDDRLDDGLIVELARRLVAEYSLLTGEPLQLFIDRDLTWGEEWRRRIDGSLVETTFFVPIVTPRYFTRPECRRELTSFYGNASSLGVTELLLPVLYAPVRNFTPDNDDELVAIVSRYQYVDWTQLRLEGHTSAAYRKEVNNLAERLVAVGEEIAARQIDREAAVAEGEPTDLMGHADVASAIEALLPAWLEALEAAEIRQLQHSAIWDIYSPRLLALERSGRGQAGAKLAILQKIAKEDRPLAEEHLRLAKDYLRIALQLEPHVSRALHISAADPEAVEIFDTLWRALDKAEPGVVRWQKEQSQEADDENLSYIWYKKRAHLSKLIRQVSDIYSAAVSTLGQANDLVALWIAERDRIVTNPHTEP